MPADLVFLNGTVITVDDEQPTAEAVAIVGNRIARVGGNDDVRDEVGPATRVVDLAGRTLLPGFNDNHTHPISYGLGLSLIDARPGTVPSLVGFRRRFAPRPRRRRQPSATGGCWRAATMTAASTSAATRPGRSWMRPPGVAPPSSPAPAVTWVSPTRRRWPGPASRGPRRTPRAGRSTATSGVNRPGCSVRPP